jgi:hypothetical protein
VCLGLADKLFTVEVAVLGGCEQLSDAAVSCSVKLKGACPCILGRLVGKALLGELAACCSKCLCGWGDVKIGCPLVAAALGLILVFRLWSWMATHGLRIHMPCSTLSICYAREHFEMSLPFCVLRGNGGGNGDASVFGLSSHSGQLHF